MAQESNVLDIETQCVDKNWKIRLQAYENAIVLFNDLSDSNGSCDISNFMNLIAYFVQDANCVAQEKGIEAVRAFINVYPNSYKSANNVVPNLITKCLGASKNSTKLLATDILLLYIELGQFDAVEDGIINLGFIHKNPKIVASSLTTYTLALNQFGNKVVRTSGIILKKTFALLENRDPIIRSNASDLLIEMYRWLGSSFKNKLKNLQEPQKLKLENDFNNISNEGNCEPKRYVRGKTPSSVVPFTPKNNDNNCTKKNEKSNTKIKKKNVQQVTKPKSISPVLNVENDSEHNVLSKIHSTLQTNIENKNGKARLDACTECLKQLHKLNLENIATESIIKTLNKPPGLNDTHIQVVEVKLVIIQYLIQHSTVSSMSLKEIFHHIFEKINDSIVANQVSDTLTIIVEVVGLNGILDEVFDMMQNGKNITIRHEALQWFISTIKRLGISSIPLNTVLDNVKQNLLSSNVNIKEATYDLLGFLYLHYGITVKEFITNELTAIRNSLDIICEKYSDLDPQIFDVKNSSPTVSTKIECINNTKESKVISIEMVQDDDNERLDISDKFSSDLIDKLDNSNWKIRNEALESISSILDQVVLIEPNLQNLLISLNRRLNDCNAKIIQTTLTVQAKLISVTGTQCKLYVPLLFPSIVRCLAHTKPSVRQFALNTMNTYSDHCEFDEFLQNDILAKILDTSSPLLKKELWSWLGQKLPVVVLKSNCKSPLIVLSNRYLYASLKDRDVEVRRYCQNAVIGFIKHLTFETMMKEIQKLQPPSLKGIAVSAVEKAQQDIKIQPSLLNAKQNRIYKVNLKQEVPNFSTNVNLTRENRNGDPCKLLTCNTLKNQRIERQSVNITDALNTSRDRFIIAAKQDMIEAGVNLNLIDNLFHLDPKFQINAIDSLLADLPKNIDSLIANLDLVLNWLSIVFFENNKNVLLKSFDYVQVIIRSLRVKQYAIQKGEAAIFLPSLLQVFKDEDPSIRSKIHTLLSDMAPVYPTGDIYACILQQISTESSFYQRLECISHLTFMLQRIHIMPLFPSPAEFIIKVSGCLNNMEASIKQTALNCLKEVYKIMGEKMYMAMTNVSEETLIEIKQYVESCFGGFKDTTTSTVDIEISNEKSNVIKKDVSADNVIKSHTLHNDTITKCTENNLHDKNDHSVQIAHEIKKNDNVINTAVSKEDVLNLSNKKINTISEAVVNNVENSKTNNTSYSTLNKENICILNQNVLNKETNPEIYKDQNLSTNESNRVNSFQKHNKPPSANLMLTIEDISNSNLIKAYKALKDLRVIVKSPSNTLEMYENEIINNITAQLFRLKDFDVNDDIVLNTYNGLLKTLIAYCGHSTFGTSITVENFKKLLTELILLHNGKKLYCNLDADSYRMGIQSVIDRLIKNCDIVTVFSALMMLLREHIRNNTDQEHINYIVDVVYKCTKKMLKLGKNVDYGKIFSHIHDLLCEFPFTYLEEKIVVSKCIKRVINAIVTIEGESVIISISECRCNRDSELAIFTQQMLKAYSKTS